MEWNTRGTARDRQGRDRAPSRVAPAPSEGILLNRGMSE